MTGACVHQADSTLNPAFTMSHVSDFKQRRRTQSTLPSSEMSIMRIAVAGTGGLARLIAHFIDEETSHHVVLLSREAKPALATQGFQVAIVDYDDEDRLSFALRGTDTVISTVTGPNQIALIRAAARARVRRFAPAEFEGMPSLRPSNSPLDRGRNEAQRLLTTLAPVLQSTNFVCGIFYERLQPGGLAHSLLGITSGFDKEGDYMVDIKNMTAQAPAISANNQFDVTICMTSVQDVARFVTKAIDLTQWPRELRMSGERIPVHVLITLIERLKGERFSPREIHNPATLRSALAMAAIQQDRAQGIRLHTLIATAEGRYDFTHSNMNVMFPSVQTIRLSDWLKRKWEWN